MKEEDLFLTQKCEANKTYQVFDHNWAESIPGVPHMSLPQIYN